MTTSGTLVETAVVSNTFTIGTANKLFVIELDVSALDLANGYTSVGVAIASPGANADFYSVIYGLNQGRYGTTPSALVD